MNASSSLLSILVPALPEPEGRLSELSATTAPVAAAESFFSVMSQVRGKSLPVLPEDSKALPEKSPAAPETLPAHDNASVASSRVAVMAQPATAPAAKAQSTAAAVPPGQTKVVSQTKTTQVTSGTVAAQPKLTAQARVQTPTQAQTQTPTVKISTPAKTEEEAPPAAAKKTTTASASQPSATVTTATPALPTPVVPETATVPLPAANSFLSEVLQSQLLGLGFNESGHTVVYSNGAPKTMDNGAAVAQVSNPKKSAESTSTQVDDSTSKQKPAPISKPVNSDPAPDISMSNMAALVLPPPPAPQMELRKSTVLATAAPIASNTQSPVSAKTQPQTNTGAPAAPIDSKRTIPVTTGKSENTATPGPAPVDNKPGSAPPAQKSVETPAPAKSPTLPKEPAPVPAAAASTISAPDPAKTPVGMAAATATSPTTAIDGTAGALSSQRMNSSGEKNEIAGSTVQKVPDGSAKEPSSGKSGSDFAGNSNQSGAKQSVIDTAPAMNWPDKASGALEAGKTAAVAAPVDHAAIQAERLGHMVNQHVTMIRQSGSNNLAVSLKLDPQTELNLQLTNHNGQIEASVSWGRGSITGLDSHWKELQDTLAKQNVQLLPLENKASSRTPNFSSGSNSDSGASFRQSSSNSQRHNRDSQPNLPLTREAGTVSASDKKTATTASRPGWESWA